MSAYSAAVLATSGLVGYWRLGDASGAAVDASSGGHNGTVTGATRGVTGLITGDSDTAYSFNGSGDIISMTGTEAINPIGSLSAIAWIKTSDVTADFRTIFAKFTSWGLFLHTGNLILYDWVAAAQQSSGVAVADNTRHQVGVSLQSGVASGSQFYIDGLPVGAAFTYTIGGGTDAWTIGGFSGGLYLAATIDEVSYYNVALAPATFAAHYTAGTTVAATGFAPGLMLPI